MSRSSRPRIVLFSAVVLGAGLAVPVAAAAATPGVGAHHSARVCAHVSRPGFASCDAYVEENAGGTPMAAGTAQQGYGPADLQSAYALTSAAKAKRPGVTIAIVDAYNDTTAASDLAKYRKNYKLPACTTKSGCLKIESGTGTTTLPSQDSSGGWELEESLDLDMVSAICPKCHILLVEATSNSDADLGTAEDTAAAAPGVRAVSNSFGEPEKSSERSLDTQYYSHPGVAIVASAGDDDYGVEYPAASPGVTAVGGTELVPENTTRGWLEGVWGNDPQQGDGTGSGCSAYEPKPSWQHDTGCSDRTVADVSADADPETGAAVYDTTPYNGSTLGWVEVGGTSEAAPIIAGVYGLGGTLSSGTWTSTIYSHTANLNDVTIGSNGSCSPAYLCTGEPGYDGPTGLGTPNGIGAF